MLLDFKVKFKSPVFKNSFWGVVSNVLQNLFLSVFFIMIARKYSTSDFANYIIANTLYSFVLGFSTLGLGYWFIREFINTDNKRLLLDKFFKMQLYVGILFYIFSVAISYALYDSYLIRSLSLIIGINIIFDNIIYVIKYLNIAELQQKKSFMLTGLEAFLKFIVGCMLFFTHIPIVILSVILISLRLLTLNLFIRYGSSNSISLREIIAVKISMKEMRSIVAQNWSFVVIGSLAVLNWRIGNIFVSKFLTLDDVANYEVSFKLLSIMYILPVIISSSIYPILLNAYKEGIEKMKALYAKTFIPFYIFGLFAYTLIYSYADYFIPILFGHKFENASQYCKEMFLVMLIFPTLLLQANVLITIKLEKLDMLCNVVNLIVNVSFCVIGLHYFKTLSVVNYSIFTAFLVFHLIQDVVLIKNKIISVKHVVSFYLISLIIIATYFYFSNLIPKEILFIIFWITFGIIISLIYFYKKRTLEITL